MVLTQQTDASNDAGDSANQGTSSSSNENNTTQPNNSANNSNNQDSRSQILLKFLTDDKILAVLCLTRLLTLAFSFMFMIPIFGYDPNTLFQKAMMSSAATSALKLHQRMNNVPFQMNREYLGRLIIEDSFHYLLYSIIFLSISPVTIVLMPISAFALLHVSDYLKKMLTITMGNERALFLRNILDACLSKEKDIMRFIAVNEILIAPTVVVLIFMGRAGIFLPFIYYRFVCMRYQSRRNPYNRMMFHELRTLIEHYISQPNCPGFLRNSGQGLINLVMKFSPPQMG